MLRLITAVAFAAVLGIAALTVTASAMTCRTNCYWGNSCTTTCN
jgi:hypothetical protein